MKISNKKTVVEGNVFTVSELGLELPSGNQLTWHIVEMKRESVFVVPLSNENEVYLVSQYRPLMERIQTEVVAGFVDHQEESLAAAKRELQEEAGLDATEWKHVGAFELTGSTVKSRQHVFVARGITESNATPEEVEEGIKTVKMPLASAIEQVLSGTIDNGPTIIALLIVDKLMQQHKL